MFDQVPALLSVIVPVVGVPLTALTFYLRGLRDQQIAAHAECRRRAAACEQAVMELRRLLHDFERNYATKEEWLRESLYHRQLLHGLRETSARGATDHQ